MPVSQACIDATQALTKQLADNLKKSVKSDLYGGTECCEHNSQNARIQATQYLISRYSTPSAEDPSIQVWLNDKQIECICKWVAAQG